MPKFQNKNKKMANLLCSVVLNRLKKIDKESGQLNKKRKYKKTIVETESEEEYSEEDEEDDEEVNEDEYEDEEDSEDEDYTDADDDEYDSDEDDSDEDDSDEDDSDEDDSDYEGSDDDSENSYETQTTEKSDTDIKNAIDQDTAILNALVAQKDSFPSKNNTLAKCITLCKKEIKSNVTLQNKRLKDLKIANKKKFSDALYSSSLDAYDTFKYFKKLDVEEQQSLINKLQIVQQDVSSIVKPYKIQVLESSLSDTFKKIMINKIVALDQMDSTSSEYGKLRNWIDNFMRIPFGRCCDLPVRLDDGVEKCHDFLTSAKQTLDDTVYGLNDIKLQLMQIIGQFVTNPESPPPPISIYGPPGTGKTSLIKDGLSKILNRPFAFITLGGASDGSFLDGHSYTFEGSIYGKIIQILIDCQCMNPIIYFDELDKVSSLPKGDEIIGVLMHLIDSSQNNQFHDKYFSEFDFDLSKCLFIFSYNDEQKVNYILRDRMYRIQTTGYNKQEKNSICSNYLVPKIIKQVNFAPTDVQFTPAAIEHIINLYCDNEEGVRNLKRSIENVYTKLNLFRLIKPGDATILGNFSTLLVEFPLTVTPDIVDALLKDKSSTLTHCIANKPNISELTLFNDLSSSQQTDIISKFKNINGVQTEISSDMSFFVNIINSNVLSEHNKCIAMDKVNLMNKFDKQEHNYHHYLTYKKWLAEFSKIPFGKYDEMPCTKKTHTDKERAAFITKCKQILGSKIHGMSQIKDKIIEFVAQLMTVKTPNVTIGIKGGVGTGKKLIVKTLGSLINRPVEIISLHDMSDEHLLEGQNSNFEGSVCGRIVATFIKYKILNPIIYFDGVDKLSPRCASIIINTLMLLTNSMTNSKCVYDKYFSDVELDVSKCIFIFGYEYDVGETTVSEMGFPRLLKERCQHFWETNKALLNHQDKLNIFRNFMLPEILVNFEMQTTDISISNEVIYYILDYCCDKNDGMKGFIKCINLLFSKVNVKRLECIQENEESSVFVINRSFVDEVISKNNSSNSGLTMYI